MQHDYQFCVHAIGDRANRETLDIYEEAFKANPDKKDLRWRIEHAQHINAADIPRFGQLGVIAAMQGIHCTSDAPLRDRAPGRDARRGRRLRLAEADEVRRRGQQRHRRAGGGRRPDRELLRHGEPEAGDGSVFYPDQRMSRMEALKSYTLNAAYSGFEEKSKGSLAPGKLADITVLTRDIPTVPDDDIPKTRVSMTILGGKTVYHCTGAPEHHP